VVTISDVAAEAQVARSTVSRALNNPGRLNFLTQQHIQAVADRLGYHPNPVARALGTQRTQTLALLLPNISNELFFGVIRGTEEQATAAGYTLVLANSKGDPDQEMSSINRLTGAVDGFILVAARMPQGQLQRIATTHRIALVNRQVLGLASAVVDPVMGATHAVDHLASLGHRQLAYLGAAPKQNWMNVRRWKSIGCGSAGGTSRGCRPGRGGWPMGAGVDALCIQDRLRVKVKACRSNLRPFPWPAVMRLLVC
jgi:LacI family transcriptional regulator